MHEKMQTMFPKMLIANRSEMACGGIATVCPDTCAGARRVKLAVRQELDLQ